MAAKNIVYDRESRDFALYLNGELVGYAKTYLEGEMQLNALVYDMLSRTTAADVADVPLDDAEVLVATPVVVADDVAEPLVIETETIPAAAPVIPWLRLLPAPAPVPPADELQTNVTALIHAFARNASAAPTDWHRRMYLMLADHLDTVSVLLGVVSREPPPDSKAA